MNRLTSKSSAIDALQTFAQAQTIFNTPAMTRTTNPDPELESAHQALDRLGAPFEASFTPNTIRPLTISERIKAYDLRKAQEWWSAGMQSLGRRIWQEQRIMEHFVGMPPSTVEQLSGQPDHSKHISAATATEVEFTRETVGICLAPGPDERETIGDYKARTGRALGNRFRVSVENYAHRFAGTPLREVRVDTDNELEAVQRYGQLCKEIEDAGKSNRVALLQGSRIVQTNVTNEILVTHAPLFKKDASVHIHPY